MGIRDGCAYDVNSLFEEMSAEDLSALIKRVEEISSRVPRRDNRRPTEVSHKAIKDNFWAAVLSGNKTRMVLKKMGISDAEFKSVYETINHQQGFADEPTAEDIEKVEEFLRTGDVKVFSGMKGQRKDALIRRVVVYKEGGFHQ